jgi:hypothetical protein
MVVAHLKVLFWHLPEGNEENQEVALDTFGLGTI